MLVGVLVDVSGSMERSLQINSKPSDQNITRSETIFRTIINIAKREAKFDECQEMFALAFGMNFDDMGACDLMQLLSIIEEKPENIGKGKKLLIKLLSENGAPLADTYVNEYVSDKEAAFIYSFFSENKHLLKKYVDELPSQCKNNLANASTNIANSTLKGFSFGFLSLDNKEKEATKTHAIRAIKEAVRQQLLSKPRIVSFERAINILERNTNRQIQSSEKLKELIESIRPFIFGNTPMCAALRSAVNIFKESSDENKSLFLLTDGEATDGNPLEFAEYFHENDVTVYVCLLTADNIKNPRKLYYEIQSEWSEAQKRMFKLSSVVDHSNRAFSVLLEKGWKIPESGKSRLFIQANHPKVIEEFTNLVIDITQSNDPILNMSARVTLDKYINSSIKGFDAKTQVGGTCYANAVAAVIYFAANRIEGREGGYPDFDKLLQTLITEYGSDGAIVTKVLDKYAKKYRLRYLDVDESKARQAINARRPVVATFWLNDEQWEKFSKFYKRTPTSVLKKQDLKTVGNSTEQSGHAVVLTKVAPNHLKFLNSWGPKFADEGFFRVENQSVLNLKFYDVYWVLDDLKPSEITAFEKKKLISARDFAKSLPQSILKFPYMCAVCRKYSPISQYKGHLRQAICPKCNHRFNPTVIGLKLNPYDY